MIRLLIDSSYFVALALPSDPNHLQARKLFLKITAKEYLPNTTEDFIKETLTIVSQRTDKSVAIDFYRLIGITARIIPINTQYCQAGLEIFLNPKLNKNISLIDCIGAAVYDDIKADAIATFDDHFKSLGLTVVPK